MKIVCLSAPRLPVQLERKRRALPADVPLIVGGRPWDPDAVLACCEIAQGAGVVPGMALARAAMRCPGATCIPADHEAYQAAHEQLLSALRQYTDRIETTGLGSCFADVEGMERIFGADESLAQGLVTAARDASELDVRVGLAMHRFTAQQAAQAAQSNTAVVVPLKQERAFLSSLPLTALPIEDEVLRRLELLGVEALGALVALPRLALIRQFGPEVGMLYDLAAGNDPRRVLPDAPPLELRQSASFEPPVFNHERLLAHANEACSMMARALSQHGYQAQGMRLELQEERGQPRATATPLEPPTADAARLIRRLGFLLERLQIQTSISDLTVVLYPLRPRYLASTQLALFNAPIDQRLRRFYEALRRLRGRFGELILVIASLVGPPHPREIHVTVGRNDAPRSLVWGDRIHLIRYVYEHWREARSWWAHPVRRYYYRVEDDGGQVRVIYRDQITGQWWMERRLL